MSTICKCCEHPNIEAIERVVRLGEKTIKWGSEQLGVTEKEFWDHINDCVIKKEEEDEIPTTLVGTLEYVTEKLRKRVKALCKLPVTPGNEKAVATQVGSLNTCIMNIAKLTKQIDTAPQIEITNITIMLQQVQEYLITNLCPECKKQFMKFLEVAKPVEELERTTQK